MLSAEAISEQSSLPIKWEVVSLAGPLALVRNNITFGGWLSSCKLFIILAYSLLTLLCFRGVFVDGIVYQPEYFFCEIIA